MFRPLRVFDKTALRSSHSPQRSDDEEWLDREIASLRQSVETDAEGQRTRDSRTDARSPRRRRLLRTGATRAAAGGRMHHHRPLRRLLRAAGRRRFEIVLYGTSIALAVAAGWFISLMLTS
jgi:hypothetical protein